MVENKPEMVRINTRISGTSNDWLDNQSMTTGIPKSTLILLAIENYIREKDAMSMMGDLGQVVQALERLEKAVERNVQE